MSGRAEDGRLVHFDLPDGTERPRPGDVVTVTVTHAAPFHLLADATAGQSLRVRRTHSGDAWEAAQAESCGVPTTSLHGSPAAPGAVSLGLPEARPNLLG
jgi:tRNA-2-methylthio-N6-dimethylallyladenosine synthase